MMRFFLWFFLCLFVACGAAAQEPDSAIQQASGQYSRPSLLGRLLLGTNYRAVWEAPVKAPVFRLSRSGLTPEELGGGQQTVSLTLEDARGKEWVLRAIDKDVSRVLLPSFVPRSTLVPLLQEMTSASFPYGPSIVSELAKAAGITAPRSRLFYVADDPALGPYRSLFAGRLCYLEQKEPTPDGSDAKKTEKLLEALFSHNEHLVIQKEVLRARLLDMMVGDWDRHADQWRWGQVQRGGERFYYAIPRDRDQAFFKSNGLLVALAKIFLPQFTGFSGDKLKLKKLNHKSWTFDRTFLNELDAAAWKEGIGHFRDLLTDARIADAVRKLPADIYTMVGPSLERALRKRRDALLEEGLSYYRYISRNVVVNGTEESESFSFAKKDDRLLLTVRDGGKTERILYERAFEPGTTYRVIVRGLGGADRFYFPPGLQSHIRVELWGGEGADVYDLRGAVRNTVYDNRKEANRFLHTSKTRKRLQSRPV